MAWLTVSIVSRTMCSVSVVSDCVAPTWLQAETRTNEVSVDAKPGELEHVSGVFGGVDLGGRVDEGHDWRGGGEAGGGRCVRQTEKMAGDLNTGEFVWIFE